MGVLYLWGPEIKGGWGQQEMDTIACKHCGATITIYLKNLGKRPDTPFRCDRCDGPICKFCGKRQAEGLQCIPIKARIDNAVNKGRWEEEFDFHYRTTTRS